MRKTAFTLVELLMVMAIITILIALLLPSFNESIELAQRIGCGDNMREITLCTQQFVRDHDGELPGPNWRRDNTHGWLYFDLQMDRREHLETGQLWDYISSYAVYRCPKDIQPDEDDPNAVPGRPNNSRMITSYCENGSVCGYGGRELYTAADGDRYWKTYRLDQFKPRDILFWECDETKSGGWWWDGSNFPWEGITHRHKGKASISCTDGSEVWMTRDEYYDIVAKRPSRLWNVPNSWNNDGRTPHKSYQGR